MAIVHDLAEAIVGDIPPTVNITSEEKHKMEGDAMQKMVEMLKNSMEAKEIQSLWMEYEEASTPEALFVKDVDKFEMIVQAFEYEKRKHDYFRWWKIRYDRLTHLLSQAKESD